MLYTLQSRSKTNKAVSAISIYILMFSDSAEINAELNLPFALTYCACISREM